MSTARPQRYRGVPARCDLTTSSDGTPSAFQLGLQLVHSVFQDRLSDSELIDIPPDREPIDVSIESGFKLLEQPEQSRSILIGPLV